MHATRSHEPRPEWELPARSMHWGDDSRPSRLHSEPYVRLGEQALLSADRPGPLHYEYHEADAIWEAANPRAQPAVCAYPLRPARRDDTLSLSPFHYTGHNVQRSAQL